MWTPNQELWCAEDVQRERLNSGVVHSQFSVNPGAFYAGQNSQVGGQPCGPWRKDKDHAMFIIMDLNIHRDVQFDILNPNWYFPRAFSTFIYLFICLLVYTFADEWIFMKATSADYVKYM